MSIPDAPTSANSKLRTQNSKWPFVALLMTLLALSLTLAAPAQQAAIAQGEVTPTAGATPPPQTDAGCAALTGPLLSQVAETCFDQGPESLCYGHGTLYPVFWGQASVAPEAFAGPGAVVPLGQVQALQGAALADAMGDSWGVGVARFTAGAPVMLVVFGEVTLIDAGGYGGPPWTTLDLLTSAPTETCPLLPSAALAQSVTRAPARLRVNEAEVVFDGTVLLQAPASDMVTVSVIAGTATVGGRVIGMGQGMRIVAGQPEEPMLPFNRDVIVASPLGLLDEVVQVPWPGAVEPTGQVNVRVRPDLTGGVVAIVEPGMFLGRLGQSADGAWLHVVLPDGLTGWVSGEYLRPVLTEIEPPALPVYDETPLPPTPLGPRARLAFVLGEGIYLREGPGRMFRPLLPTLLPGGMELVVLARNPVGDWLLVRAEVDGQPLEGWVYRLGVETEVQVEALAVPETLPTPSEATATPLPGSSGGAFPPPGPTFTLPFSPNSAEAYFVYDATRCPPGREEGANLAIISADGERVLTSWEVRTGGGHASETITIAADYTIQIDLIRYYGDTGEVFLEQGIPFILGAGQTFVYPGCAAPDPLRYTPTPTPEGTEETEGTEG